MTYPEFTNYIFNYHNTWEDVAASCAGYLFVIGVIYVWRTTRKK